ncbi:hypothetical protein AXF42_Ash009449 [Apostasia shenzhenica]|uniref:Chitinase domain-containing protein 1 n=1 Tax=Apostasia shenzhenica TaxID=1088818 RepID=A0A2I0B8X6_9ASPA|nr:hypothetical protein AXF42_Ash009449 [Apostasia shenzhenica]
MASRKRHRAKTDSDSRSQKSSKEPDQDNLNSGNARNSHLSISSSILFSIVLFLIVYFSIFYEAYNSPSKATLSRLSIYESGLVKSDINFQEVLNENARVPLNCSLRHFSNPVLAYITPWNSKGYEVAKEFTTKFTHISPVWYELRSEGKKLVLNGRHNVDMGWISQLRINGNAVVLPRVVLETFPADLLLKKKQWSKASNIILQECKEMEYDGIVLESWSRWAAYGVLHDRNLRSTALEFIKQLGQSMHSVNSLRNSNHLELIYVIPAPHSQNLAEYDFGPQDLRELSGFVDGFSLMTYDFAGPQNPGPNAPLSWMRSSMQLLLGGDHDGVNRSHMIFLGINLYGNDFVISQDFAGSGSAITGRDYLSLLVKHRPELRWDERSAEHYFIYTHNNAQHVVFYPSLKSISMRLDEARAWGVGLSIWEIGQGLDYFFDLL